jgi:galactosylgalactosylxylosylprotein 3-beta-glucuronosyltransferase 3
LESEFISQLIGGPHELEPKGDQCRRILVWHTRTEDPNIKREAKLPAEPFMQI